MNKKQNGFALIESLLIILILVIIGFGGYYVWNTQKNVDETSKDATSASQSTTSSPTAVGKKMTLGTDVSLETPSNWQTATLASICNGTDNPVQCTDSIETAPADVTMAQSGDAFGVSIGRYNFSDGVSYLPHGTDAKSWLFNNWCGCTESEGWSDAAFSSTGYDAIHATQKDSQYVDEYYVVHKGQTIVLITARTKDTSTTAVQTGTTKDYTKYDTQIRQIASSVKISQ